MITLLKEHIDDLLRSGKQIIVAIDGPCAAGKTTLTAALEKEYDCNVFHMDDFFLRPEQRTAERYAQPGGNVVYERFREDVLIPLKKGETFSYCPFSCKSFTLTDPVTVCPKKLNIIEGTYSLHPYVRDAYDLKVFLMVDADLQKQRIQQRPQHLHARFFQEWIPMEKRYFDHFQTPALCELCFDINIS